MGRCLQSAYLLVSHGSRDPRPQAAMAKLATWVRDRLQQTGANQPTETEKYPEKYPESCLERYPEPPLFSPSPLVETATLELADEPLHQCIQRLGDRALALGYHHLRIVPLFLLPGVHVRDDLPREVAIAQQYLGNRLQLWLCPHLGSHPRLGDMLQWQPLPSAGSIVVAHGSRRAGGNQPVEQLSAQIGALPAYWSIPPTLETQVHIWITARRSVIHILPYFLFAGGILDAIAQQVQHLAGQYPGVQFHLAPPIGASARLADVILDLAPDRTLSSFTASLSQPCL